MSRSDPASAIRRRADRRAAPLSFAQESFWFLEQLAPGTPRHNMAMAMGVEGPLDVQALARAFAASIERHETLRTTFVDDRGEPRQIVHPPPPAVLLVADLSGLPRSIVHDAARRLARRGARTPFDLSRGPLLRVVLWRLAVDDHVLATTMHHIVGDAWSLDVLMREVTSAFADVRAGRPPALPPLPIQYADYAAWERAQSSDAARATALDYWATQLADAAPLDLPTDHPRSAVRTFRGASQAWRFDGAEYEQLRRTAASEHATVFMALVAAYAAVLGRYAQQDRVTIGSPMAAHRSPQTAPLIGPFLNTIVFRLDTGGTLSLCDYLARVRDVVVDALAHGDVPFDRVVQRIRRGTALDDAPLFDVVIASRPSERKRMAAPGLQMHRLLLDEESAQFDLTLYVGSDADGLGGVLNYSTELFEPPTIARFVEHLTHMLRAIAERPSMPLAEVPLLTETERYELATALTGPVVGSRESGVHELFARRAVQTPDAVAIVRDRLSVTYREANRRVDDVCRRLRARGIRRGDRVALCLDRRPPLIFALLGVLKAGACYVPLDPAVPRERLQSMMRSSGAAIAITERSLEWLWRSMPDTACLFLDDQEAIDADPPAVSTGDVGVDDPAYVIFTSGSTGEPKGVVTPHGALLNSCAAVAEATGIGRGDRFLHFAPIGFDVAAFQIFPALTTGATVVLAPPPDELSNDDIVALCDDGLTILDLPSAVWQQWIDDLAIRRGRLPSSVRVFMTGGESTPVDGLRRWAAMVDPSATLVSSYGPTETAVTSIWVGRAGDVASGAVTGVTLGRPVRNVRLDILDRADQPVPIGVTGELRVAGRGLALGYVNDRRATADRFRPDPYASRPGTRSYRTGDHVRYRGDGTLEFVGRRDQQVKVRGVRVEIEEIERLLRQHPRVRAAAVTMAAPAASARPSLTAYVVVDEPAPDEMELREHLAVRLQRAVLPTAYCFLPALPVSANGKVDRRALSTLQGTSAERPRIAARSLTEQVLVEIWADALGTSAAGVSDDFFAAGGDSLAAARLSARLREAFGIDVPVRTVFEARTIEQLARAIDVRRRRGDEERAVPVVVARDAPLDVSFAQQGFWLLQQLDLSSPIFANPEVVHLRGPLSVPALARALTQVVARHEALRTTFAAVDGVPKQIIGPPYAVTVPVVDLGAIHPAQREIVAARLARHDSRRPFDLVRGPLLRAAALRMAGDDHLILFTMHHLVSDGWSMGVLLHEINAGYRAILDGAAPALDPLPLQYADYAVWQRSRWNDARFDEAVDACRRAIGDAAAGLDLPTDRPRPIVQRFLGARHRLPIDDELIGSLRALGRREGVTLFMTLLGALGVLLHRYTGQRAIAVAAPVANRGLRATERLIGVFINHVLIATRFDGDPTGREVLRRVRASTLEAFDHQELPYDELVRRLDAQRYGAYTPLTPVLFNHMNVPQTSLDLPGLRVEPTRLRASHRPRFDLEWNIVETAGTTTGTIGYDCALFNPSTIERMAADYALVLGMFLETPDRPVSTLRLMTDTQATLASAFSEPF